MNTTRRRFGLAAVATPALRSQEGLLVKSRRKPADPWQEYPTRTLDRVEGFPAGARTIVVDQYGGRADRKNRPPVSCFRRRSAIAGGSSIPKAVRICRRACARSPGQLRCQPGGCTRLLEPPKSPMKFDITEYASRCGAARSRSMSDQPPEAVKKFARRKSLACAAHRSAVPNFSWSAAWRLACNRRTGRSMRLPTISAADDGTFPRPMRPDFP
jgi:hypothetical protein